MLKRNLTTKSTGFLNCFGVLNLTISFILLAFATTANAGAYNKANLQQQDTTLPKKDTLPYPIHDRRGDFISSGGSPIDLNKPSNIQDSVVYDPATHMYIVYEKIGTKFYRTPTAYTSAEFMALQGRKAEVDYFKKRGNTLNVLNRGMVKPKLNVYDKLFNRLFGNGEN